MARERLKVDHHGPLQYSGKLHRIIDGQRPILGVVAWSIASSREDKQIQVNRVTLGGLACGLALLLAAGCGGGGLSENGPFGNSGQNSGTICAWTTPGGVVHDGFEEFYDTGGTATVDRVALVEPRHLH